MNPDLRQRLFHNRGDTVQQLANGLVELVSGEPDFAMSPRQLVGQGGHRAVGEPFLGVAAFDPQPVQRADGGSPGRVE